MQTAAWCLTNGSQFRVETAETGPEHGMGEHVSSAPYLPRAVGWLAGPREDREGLGFYFVDVVQLFF